MDIPWNPETPMPDFNHDWLIAAFSLSNTVRTFFFLPQVLAVARSIDGARDIALSTWCVGTRLASQASPPARRPLMNESVIDIHHGIRFKVEAVPQGELFAGHFTILEHPALRSGSDDSYRPTTDNAWATPNEALTYATEAAHHAIEGIPPFNEGQPE